MKINKQIIEVANAAYNGRERKIILAQKVLNVMTKGEPMRATEIWFKLAQTEEPMITIQKLTACLKWLWNNNIIDRKNVYRGEKPCWIDESDCVPPPPLPDDFDAWEQYHKRKPPFEPSWHYVVFIKK